MHNPRTNEAVANRQGAIIFCISSWGLCSVRRAENELCPLRSNFRRKFAPDSIHARECDGLGGVFGYLSWGD